MHSKAAAWVFFYEWVPYKKVEALSEEKAGTVLSVNLIILQALQVNPPYPGSTLHCFKVQSTSIN